jgi:putative glutamine amidotransferase
MRGVESHKQTPQGEPPRKELALGLSYPNAVAAAGGVPLVVPPTDPDVLGPLLEQVAGVCLSGGPDLDPSLYGAEPHPELGPIDPEVDRFELAMARQADSLGLPLLAICRGAQTLNVARGGTLHQHVPDHRQTEPGTEVTHSVDIEAGSTLAGLMGGEHVQVNSFHHQAIDRLGRGLRAVAWSPDGVIEGVEDDSREFLVGVQWHAETLTHRPEHAALFTRLVETARPARARRRVRRVA